MNKLFDRKCRVTLAKPIKGSFTKAEPNATVITELRMSFKIEKKLQKNPNTAEITIYNLNEASRALTQKKPLYVRLEAGYDGDISTLWEGDMTYSSSKLDGPNWVTTIEVANGMRAFNYARASKSFSEKTPGGIGTSVHEVIETLAKSMGMNVSIPADLKAELKAKEIPHATAVHGPVRKSMDKVTKTHGVEWSIQDNQIQVLRPNQLRADQAWLISEDTGMVGSPEFNAPKKPGESPVLKVKSLLHAKLVPGQKVKVVSRAINGVFRLESVRHSGDTDAKDWYSDVECKPV